MFFAVLFLSLSTLFEFLCIFLYAYVFGKLPIVKHFRKKAALEGSQTVTSDLAAAGIQTTDNANVKLCYYKTKMKYSIHIESIYIFVLLQVSDAKPQRLSNKELIHQNRDHAFNLWFIYALTLSIFPGFLYENTGEHQLGSW